MDTEWRQVTKAFLRELYAEVDRLRRANRELEAQRDELAAELATLTELLLEAAGRGI